MATKFPNITTKAKLKFGSEGLGASILLQEALDTYKSHRGNQKFLSRSGRGWADLLLMPEKRVFRFLRLANGLDGIRCDISSGWATVWYTQPDQRVENVGRMKSIKNNTVSGKTAVGYSVNRHKKHSSSCEDEEASGMKNKDVYSFNNTTDGENSEEKQSRCLLVTTQNKHNSDKHVPEDGVPNTSERKYSVIVKNSRKNKAVSGDSSRARARACARNNIINNISCSSSSILDSSINISSISECGDVVTTSATADGGDGAQNVRQTHKTDSKSNTPVGSGRRDTRKKPAYFPPPPGYRKSKSAGPVKSVLDKIIGMHTQKWGAFSVFPQRRGRLAASVKSLISRGIPGEVIQDMFFDYLQMDEFRLVRRYHPWEAFLDLLPVLLRRQVPVSEEAVSLTDSIFQFITKNIPEILSDCERKRKDWVFVVDDLIHERLSCGDTIETIQSVLEWSSHDPFWSSKIVSAQFFCDNYVKIKQAMESTRRWDILRRTKDSVFARPLPDMPVDTNHTEPSLRADSGFADFKDRIRKLGGHSTNPTKLERF